MNSEGGFFGGLKPLDLIVAGALLVALTVRAHLLHGMPAMRGDLIWRLAPGLLAAGTYLAFREIWTVFRHDTDEEEDLFFRVRFVSMCGAAIFALSPFAEQAIRCRRVGLFLFIAYTYAVFLWCAGCRCRRAIPYAVAYVIFGFVAGANPVGLLTTAPFLSLDLCYRWHHSTPRGQREEDVQRKKESVEEGVISLVAFVLGAAAGSWAFGLWSSTGLVDWYSRISQTTFTADFSGVLLAGVTYLVAPAIGRRIREKGRHGRLPGMLLAMLIAFVAVALAARPFI